jgi:predicted DNA repair protein MutK
VRWVICTEKCVDFKKNFLGRLRIFEAFVRRVGRITESVARFVVKVTKFVGKVERLLTNGAIVVATVTRFLANEAIDSRTNGIVVVNGLSEVKTG